MESEAPPYLALDDEAATDVARTGGKAAALSRAGAAGLRISPGVVVPVEATVGSPEEVAERLQPHLAELVERLSTRGQTLIVRSSSPSEDRSGESMAGRFESIGGVSSPAELRKAIGEVVRSRDEVAEQEDLRPAIALLIQGAVEAACGGVMFTIDPVTSDRSKVVVSASAEGPDALVSGDVDGSTYVLDRDGAVLERSDGQGGAEIDPEQLVALTRLAARVEDVFAGPQDVEWAIDPEGVLWLLQSRPITVVREFPLDPDGEMDDDLPILGPGPVAETYPVALHALERDLWVPPLREALRRVFHITSTTADRNVEASPIVEVVEGYVVADLDLFELSERPRPAWARLDPRPKLRRLRAAWRIGRLRGSLLSVAQAVVDATDERLGEVPELGTLTDRQLLGMLERTGDLLQSLHGHEVLVGLLLEEEAPGLTGPSVALRILATAREDGWEDHEIVRHHPIVLALAPPQIAPRPVLPATPAPLPPRPIAGEDTDAVMILREALRIRVRWLQELQVRTAVEIGHRLVEAGLLEDPIDVRLLLREEVRAALEHRAVVSGFEVSGRRPSGATVPAAFQIQGDRVIPVAAGGEGGGTGAGGGQGSGPARISGDPEPGDVLVVRTLDPALGAIVGQLGGLVAETGSVLSHVAILAREAGIPTVVGFAGATTRFEDGERLSVDGSSGTVEREGS